MILVLWFCYFLFYFEMLLSCVMCCFSEFFWSSPWPVFSPPHFTCTSSPLPLVPGKQPSWHLPLVPCHPDSCSCSSVGGQTDSWFCSSITSPTKTCRGCLTTVSLHRLPSWFVLCFAFLCNYPVFGVCCSFFGGGGYLFLDISALVSILAFCLSNPVCLPCVSVFGSRREMFAYLVKAECGILTPMWVMHIWTWKKHSSILEFWWTHFCYIRHWT